WPAQRAAPAHRGACACAGDRGESDRGPHRPGAGRGGLTGVRGAELIYGMHAVRIMLERYPERVLAVQLAERREDPRARAIEELARRQQRPLQRVDAQALRKRLGAVPHQGVAAEVTPLAPWTEDDLLTGLASAP